MLLGSHNTMEISVITEPSITVGRVPGERRWSGAGIRNRKWLNLSPKKSARLEMEMEEGSGGKMVVELVGAFNKLTKRMSDTSSPATTGGESVVFDALKLSIPLLRGLPDSPGGRPALSRALAVALTLADLRMDAEVVSAALLLHPLQARAATLHQVRARLGPGTAHLLHDALRLSNALLLHDNDDEDGGEDDDSAAALRRYCLTLYDSRAVALELAAAADAMAHQLPHLPRYDRQRLSLRVLRLHAPLAHALGLPLPLEDLAFRHLFPYSYLYLDAWLRSHNPAGLLESCRARLLRALRTDPALSCLASDVAVTSRHKSRYSTMRKILKDGRRPQDVNDVLGLRVVVRHVPRPEDRDGRAACYRTRDVARSIWGEVDGRDKDYVANPKPNGYQSLHMAVEVPPVMEIQIRTAEMDSAAAGGAASHSFYKAGLADQDEAVRLKAIMVAAAELAALRLRDIPSASGAGDGAQRVFRLLDKNGDGRISVEELREVMEELGAPGEEDARQMMSLLDANSDGSLSSDEFESFQKQVDFMRSLDNTDDRYKTMLNERLQFDQTLEE